MTVFRDRSRRFLKLLKYGRDNPNFLERDLEDLIDEAYTIFVSKKPDPEIDNYLDNYFKSRSHTDDKRKHNKTDAVTKESKDTE